MREVMSWSSGGGVIIGVLVCKFVAGIGGMTGGGVCGLGDRVYIVSEIDRGWVGMSGISEWNEFALDSGLDTGVMLGSEKSVVDSRDAVKLDVWLVAGTGVTGTGVFNVVGMDTVIRRASRSLLARAGVDVFSGLSTSDVASGF